MIIISALFICFLNVILRQDEDQCARRHLQMYLGIKDPDYYEFEGNHFITCTVIAIYSAR